MPRKPKPPSCEDCYFRKNMLCALELEEPCTTFRPDRPEGLVPPRQPVLLMRPPRWATHPRPRKRDSSPRRGADEAPMHGNDRARRTLIAACLLSLAADAFFPRQGPGAEVISASFWLYGLAIVAFAVRQLVLRRRHGSDGPGAQVVPAGPLRRQPLRLGRRLERGTRVPRNLAFVASRLLALVVLAVRDGCWRAPPSDLAGLRRQRAAGGYVLPHATPRSLRPDARRQLEPRHLREPAHDAASRPTSTSTTAASRSGRWSRSTSPGSTWRRSGSRSAAASWRSSASGRCRRPRAASTSRSRSPPARSGASSSCRSTSTPTAPRRPTRTACCASSCRCATPSETTRRVPIGRD